MINPVAEGYHNIHDYDTEGIYRENRLHSDSGEV